MPVSVTPQEARKIAEERDAEQAEEYKTLFQIGLEAALERIEPGKMDVVEEEILQPLIDIKKVWMSVTEPLFKKYFSKILGGGKQVLISFDRRDLPALFSKIGFSTLTELKKSKLSAPMDYDTLASILDVGTGDGYILRSDVPKKSGDLKNIILRDSTSDSEYMFILGENVNGVFIRDDNLRFLCFGCGEVSDLSHLYYKSDLMIGEGKNHPTRRTLYLNLEYICEKCSQSLAEVQFQFSREFIVDKNIPYIF